jgi:hypothetical protein
MRPFADVKADIRFRRQGPTSDFLLTALIRSALLPKPSITRAAELSERMAAASISDTIALPT